MSPELMSVALGVVLSSPDGARSVEVARAIGRSQSRAQLVLSALLSAGKIGRTSVGNTCRWTRPGDEDRVDQKIKDESLRSAIERGRAASLLKAREYSERRKEVRATSRAMLRDEPIQRVVPAAAAPRLKTRAVRSVWELGA